MREAGQRRAFQICLQRVSEPVLGGQQITQIVMNASGSLQVLILKRHGEGLTKSGFGEIRALRMGIGFAQITLGQDDSPPIVGGGSKTHGITE